MVNNHEIKGREQDSKTSQAHILYRASSFSPLTVLREAIIPCVFQITIYNDEFIKRALNVGIKY